MSNYIIMMISKAEGGWVQADRFKMLKALKRIRGLWVSKMLKMSKMIKVLKIIRGPMLINMLTPPGSSTANSRTRCCHPSEMRH